jgi:hypothetical protein
MKQVWRDLLFIHYEIDPDQIQSQLPKGLEVDIFEGKTYIAVVPFHMTGIRPRFLPSLPYISNFAELNVRAYVQRKGKQGVWFFSLDAANPIAVEIARSFFYLPYMNASMQFSEKNQRIKYSSFRKDKRGKNAELILEYEPVSEVYYSQKKTLENWLTERYCLYSVDKKGNIYRGEIHHQPWQLQKAKMNLTENTMLSSHDLTIQPQEPILHFSKYIEVAIYNLEKENES